MTSEVAIQQHSAVVVPDQEVPGFDLEYWARQATAAAIYAERVCSTLAVPAAYRGKPAEATAAILKGTELGFGPMASLNAFDNIQGTPAPKAITLRAVVQGKGHKVKVLEQSATRAVVTGLRKGDDPDKDWQTSTWDIPRAKKLSQYKSNPNWISNPEAMLVARATAEVARWVGADAIMGMPYAAEEIRGEPAFTVVEAPVTRRLTVADLDAAPAAIEQAPDEPLTDAQRGQMFALWGELGYGDNEQDRKTRLEVTARFIGAESLESSNDLTAAEADTVIAKLLERKAQTAAGEPQ